MQKVSLESQLGIILITHNRAAYLKKTFSYLQNTPFINCSITVFDNHSTDETAAVCKEVLQSHVFKNMKIVRHPHNIGGNANILYALQAAELNYTWVLCDDDYIEPQGWDDVIEEICKGESSSILLNATVTGREQACSAWRGKHFTLNEMIMEHKYFLYHLGFLPNAINRFDLIRKHIAEVAMFCGYYYPHLAIHIFADKNTRYYCAKKQLLVRGKEFEYILYAPTSLSFARVCQFIEEKKLRHRAISHSWQAYGYKTPLRLWSAQILFLGIREHYSLGKKLTRIAEMFLFSNWLGRGCILLLFPLVFFPDAIVPWLYYIVKHKKLNNHSYFEKVSGQGRV